MAYHVKANSAIFLKKLLLRFLSWCQLCDKKLKKQVELAWLFVAYLIDAGE